ncbi:hypothetical protein FIBSPDRAFT_836078 [Athelia psychrophila]|uniref:Uncharacterized protein n=1 Tax=Athelia psychrophila TaxID=1759441 RepID=A0A166BF89_9AGAM|nr:hypothetical protein FIBSPDRAFT_836078 [Fibularhizoctonia sp. CBS 109695]
MLVYKLPQRAASITTRSDARSAILPQYRSVAVDTAPPSYASRSDTASVLDPGARMDRWRIQIPVGSPAQEALSIPDTSSNGDSSHESASPIAQRTFYYRVYGEVGAVQSKYPFDTTDLAMGCANANWVAPPSTAANIKRFLSTLEGLDDTVLLELYSGATSTAPLEDGRIIPISTGVGPGSSIEDPLMLKILQNGPAPTVPAQVSPPALEAQRSKMRSSWKIPVPTIRRTRGATESSQGSGSPTESARYPPSSPSAGSSMSSPAPSIRSISSISGSPQEREFNVKVKAKWDVDVSDPSWLSIRKGEYLVTDGVIKIVQPKSEKVVLVKNAAGEHGYVYRDDLVGR